jgi:hypothetical protein
MYMGKHGVYGDNAEMMAISEVYNVSVEVHVLRAK